MKPSSETPQVAASDLLPHVEPDAPGYPWTHACVHPQNLPVPGTLWSWGESFFEDGHVPHFDELVRAYLAMGLAMAGRDGDEAGYHSSMARRLRQQARAILLGSAWNVTLFAVTNANLCGGSDPQRPGWGGRRVDLHVLDQSHRLGICCLPVHDDVALAIKERRAPRRTIDMDGNPMHRARSMPLLYLPALRLSALASGRVEVCEDWTDGSSAMLPPPAVQALGLEAQSFEAPWAA